MRKLMIAAASVAVMLGTGTIAMAQGGEIQSDSQDSYSVRVPNFGKAFTGEQTKTRSDIAAELWSGTVSGGKRLNTCLTGVGYEWCMSATHDIGNDTNRWYGTWMQAGAQARIKFDTKWSTWGDISATGTWRAN